MEFTNIELAIINEIVTQAPSEQIRELDELQLALVGGGGGDAVVQ